jgi:hypothetical protein
MIETRNIDVWPPGIIAPHDPDRTTVATGRSKVLRIGSHGATRESTSRNYATRRPSCQACHLSALRSRIFSSGGRRGSRPKSSMSSPARREAGELAFVAAGSACGIEALGQLRARGAEHICDLEHSTVAERLCDVRFPVPQGATISAGARWKRFRPVASPLTRARLSLGNRSNSNCWSVFVARKVARRSRCDNSAISRI